MRIFAYSPNSLLWYCFVCLFINYVLQHVSFRFWFLRGMLPPADKTASIMKNPETMAPPAPGKKRRGDAPPYLPFTPIEPQPGTTRTRDQEEEEPGNKRRVCSATQRYANICIYFQLVNP